MGGGVQPQWLSLYCTYCTRLEFWTGRTIDESDHICGPTRPDHIRRRVGPRRVRVGLHPCTSRTTSRRLVGTHLCTSRNTSVNESDHIRRRVGPHQCTNLITSVYELDYIRGRVGQQLLSMDKSDHIRGHVRLSKIIQALMPHMLMCSVLTFLTHVRIV